jgi:hypothetical protein
MESMILLRHSMLVVLCLATLTSAADQKSVRIHVKESGQTKYFDPRDPPAEMPSLQPPEAAVTVSVFGCASQMRVLILDESKEDGNCKATARIESIEITLNLDVTIWLPKNPSRKLRIHENAHKQISKHYFTLGPEVAERLARPYIGKEITGKASDCTQAVDEAIKRTIKEIASRYMAEIEVRAGHAQEAFDEITDHGRNDVKESDAIQQAIERIAQQVR